MLRSRTALVLTGLAIVALIVVTLVSPGNAQERRPATDRLGGETRAATAVAISRSTWADDEPTAVFVANGYTFADALTAPSVAGTYLGPILLVAPDAIPQVVSDELDRLGGVERAFVLGGQDAVGPAVQQRLEERYGADGVERLAGEDRFETAVAVAREVAGATGNRHRRGQAHGVPRGRHGLRRRAHRRFRRLRGAAAGAADRARRASRGDPDRAGGARHRARGRRRRWRSGLRRRRGAGR